MTLGYTSELKAVFSQPKYSTMEELTTWKDFIAVGTKIKMNDFVCKNT